MSNTLNHAFGRSEGILVGMVHLPPLASMMGYPGLPTLIEKAKRDIEALEEAGFDGALLENNADKPHTEFANEAQKESFLSVAQEITRMARIPVGVQVMLNDWRASFDIAAATGASFSRLDVFVDNMSSEWGDIYPEPEKITTYKKQVCPELFLFTDIQVKHKQMKEEVPLIESARKAIAHGSDCLVITGIATGVETPLSKLEMVRTAFPNAPLFVGAGITEENVHVQLGVAQGAIVGTSIQTNGFVDVEKAKRLFKRAPR